MIRYLFCSALACLIPGTVLAQVISPPSSSGVGGGNVTSSNDTNVTVSLGGTPTAAALKAFSINMGWTGTLALARGGCQASTAAACFQNIAPTPTRAGDIIYWDGSTWNHLAGNNAGNANLQENASGAPSWATAAGTINSGNSPYQVAAYTAFASSTVSGSNPDSLLGFDDPVIDNNAAGVITTTTGTGNTGAPHTLTVASATGWNVGMGIAVAGAGASGAELVTSISACGGSTSSQPCSSTTFTLVGSIATNVTNATVNHDDTAAINAALAGSNLVHLRGGSYNVTCPSGGTIFSIPSPMVLAGDGPLTKVVSRCANGNVFAAAFNNSNGGSTDINGGAIVRDLEVDQSASVAATGGYGFVLGSGTNGAYTANVHVERLKFQDLCGGIEVLNGTDIDWFKDVMIVNSPCTNEAGIMYSAQSPSGDVHFDGVELTEATLTIPQEPALQITASDTTEFTNLKITSWKSGIVFGSCTNTCTNTRFTQISVEGPSGCFLDFGTTGTVNGITIQGFKQGTDAGGGTPICNFSNTSQTTIAGLYASTYPATTVLTQTDVKKTILLGNSVPTGDFGNGLEYLEIIGQSNVGVGQWGGINLGSSKNNGGLLINLHLLDNTGTLHTPNAAVQNLAAGNDGCPAGDNWGFSRNATSYDIQFANLSSATPTFCLSTSAIFLAQGGTIEFPGLTNVATTSAVCFNTATGLLSYDGTLGTCNTSDERLKNIGPRIDDALDRLLKINGFYFTYKDQKTYGKGEQIGVGAQTVEKVFPELVSTDKHGMKSVAYDKMAAPIIEALREIVDSCRAAANDNFCQQLLKRVDGG